MMGLRTIFWVDALKLRAESGFAAFYVSRRGDEDAGAVLVKVVRAQGDARLYVPHRDADGARVWDCYKSGQADEAEIDAYCARRSDQDPDLWLLEIEDREGRHFLRETVIETSRSSG